MTVDNQIDEKSREILEASRTLDTILEERYRMEKLLIDIKEACRKGRFNLARLKEERDSLTREFWRAKSG